MSKPYHVIKLLRYELYPTYQFHAYMASGKTDPKAGFRLAALITMQWLRLRLDNEVPEEWASLLPPEDYLKATDEDLPSLYINQGHVVNVVSLPKEGLWTMQITEPDLGNEPGNPEQTRQPVPGRVIETNIAFKLVEEEKTVECGFKIVISDPVGTEPRAEVYRIAVVRQLMEHPDFGLKQVIDVKEEVLRLQNNKQVEKMLWVTNHRENQIPTVIFTQPVVEKSNKPFVFGMNTSKTENEIVPVKVVQVQSKVVEPPYNLEKFVHYTFSYCNTYVLENAENEYFKTRCGIKFKPGEIIILYPMISGGGTCIVPYKPMSKKRDETLLEVEEMVKDFLRNQEIGYGRIVFLSGAREQLLQHSNDLVVSANNENDELKVQHASEKSQWQEALNQKDRALLQLEKQLEKQKENSARLASEAEEARTRYSNIVFQMDVQKQDRAKLCEYIARKRKQPKKYEDIKAWVEECFSDRLVFHDKAEGRLLNSPQRTGNANIELICDALDYLATEYWEQRYGGKAKLIADTYCAEKYGRPFKINPSGQMSTAKWPSEYKIKYFKNEHGKKYESPLDYHLRSGNDTEYLVRIYFLHDDKKKKIVIGSLPDHLPTVTND